MPIPNQIPAPSTGRTTTAPSRDSNGGGGAKLEREIGTILERHFPHSYLASVPIFRPDSALLPKAMAQEVDYLLHIQKGDNHELIIIECKSCKITGPDNSPLNDADDWVAHYPGSEPGRREKSVKLQLRRQKEALLRNIEPLDERERLSVYALVVASELEAANTQFSYEFTPDFKTYLLGRARFFRLISQLTEHGHMPLRVQESEILRRLRFGQPVPELGHPEIHHAVRYAARCRRFIDSELFQHFKPRQRSWAINGSAGMGKSVLLAYSLAVLVTDRFIDQLRDGTTRHLNDFTEGAGKIGVPPIDKRRIWVVALSHKQKSSLEAAYESFGQLYHEIDRFNHYQRVRPEIHLWWEVDKLDCNILLIDESHDLNDAAQEKIHQWFNESSDRYLIIACDRHQKLRLISKSAKLLNGFDFSGRTTRLDRNYRNPFPVYAAAIGLMFRWFASVGTRVIPTREDVEAGFGFQVEAFDNAGAYQFVNRNDAHPANNWSHLVTSFKGPKEAFAQLSENRLGRDDVLWVRFDAESPEFDYEVLNRFTYHNLFSEDSAETIDKYIKGQEFPIVVVEGLPSEINATGLGSARAMWLARRLVYLVASRATVFLMFVKSGRESEATNVEMGALLHQMSRPLQHDVSPSGKTWSVRFNTTPEAITMDAYLDVISDEAVTPSTPDRAKGKVVSPTPEAQTSSRDRTEERPPKSSAEIATPVERGAPPVSPGKERVPANAAKQATARATTGRPPELMRKALAALRPFGVGLAPMNDAESYCVDRLLRFNKPSPAIAELARASLLKQVNDAILDIKVRAKSSEKSTPLAVAAWSMLGEYASKQPPLPRSGFSSTTAGSPRLPERSVGVAPGNEKDLPVCLMKRPITPFAIARSVSASRERIAAIMAQAAINAREGEELSDYAAKAILLAAGHRLKVWDTESAPSPHRAARPSTP